MLFCRSLYKCLCSTSKTIYYTGSKIHLTEYVFPLTRTLTLKQIIFLNWRNDVIFRESDLYPSNAVLCFSGIGAYSSCCIVDAKIVWLNCFNIFSFLCIINSNNPLLCFLNPIWNLNHSFLVMGVENLPVCEGLLEKKVEHRRLPIGSNWKQKYCVLNSEALRIYRSKAKMVNGCAALRTVPLCHIKSVTRVYEEKDSELTYFNVLTEQRETLSFRCRDKVGWVAQIQIQLIHYKVRNFDWLILKCLDYNVLLVLVTGIQVDDIGYFQLHVSRRARFLVKYKYMLSIYFLLIN